MSIGTRFVNVGAMLFPFFRERPRDPDRDVEGDRRPCPLGGTTSPGPIGGMPIGGMPIGGTPIGGGMPINGPIMPIGPIIGSPIGGIVPMGPIIGGMLIMGAPIVPGGGGRPASP